MLIKDFVEIDKNCPFCHKELIMVAENKALAATNNYSFSIKKEEDRLIINVRNDYFISTYQKSFEFSISLSNGNILYCNRTSQFVSLYDLHIILKKKCDYCIFKKNLFEKRIEIFYDRSESVFTSRALSEAFSISDNDNYYLYCNNFEEKTFFLRIKSKHNQKAKSKIVDTPHVPFTKFDFNNKENLLKKIQSMRLLS